MTNINEEERVPFSDPMFSKKGEVIKSFNISSLDDIEDINIENSVNLASSANSAGFDYYEEDKKERSILPLIFLILLGIAGYFGYNYFQSDNKKDTKESNVIKEISDTQIEKEKLNNNGQEKNIISTANKLKPETKQEEIIESVISDKPKSQLASASIAKKVENHIEDKVVKKEKLKSNIGTTSTKVTQNDNKIENMEEIKAKVVQALKKSKDKKISQNIVKIQTPEYKLITVKKGDTLASIAKKFYGNSMMFDKIVMANLDIEKDSTLHIGQQIVVPTIDPEEYQPQTTRHSTTRHSTIRHSTTRHSATNRIVIRVKKGDTLESIAKRFYGNSSKYQRIIDANHKIKNKYTILHIGQKIYIPR